MPQDQRRSARYNKMTISRNKNVLMTVNVNYAICETYPSSSDGANPQAEPTFVDTDHIHTLLFINTTVGRTVSVTVISNTVNPLTLTSCLPFHGENTPIDIIFFPLILIIFMAVATLKKYSSKILLSLPPNCKGQLLYWGRCDLLCSWMHWPLADGAQKVQGRQLCKKRFESLLIRCIDFTERIRSSRMQIIYYMY